MIGGPIGAYIARPALSISITILIVATFICLYLSRVGARGRLAAFVTALVSLLSVFFVLLLLPAESIPDRASQFFIFDGFAKFFSLFAIFVTMAITVSTYYYSEGLPETPSFYALITGTAIGLILLPAAVDLIGMFVAWELLSVPLYAIVAYSHDWSKSSEGAIKYYIMGTASSAILGLGIGLISALAGTTNMYAMSEALSGVLGLTGRIILGISVVSLIVGFGVKITMVPLHQWAPDTYEGSMPPITAYLAGTIKAVRFSAPLRLIMLLAPSLSYYARLYFAVLGFLTMTYANIVALKQTSVYRMMAYSSIAQMGYVVIGLVAATLDGITASIFYVFAFAMMEVVVFVVIAITLRYMGLETVDDYNGLASRYPSLAIIFALSLLSLVGIPPMVGFAGKVYLFVAAWSGGLAWLAIALAINSAISIGYYGLIVKRMFLDEPSSKVSEAKARPPRSLLAVLWILTAIIFVLGIYPRTLSLAARYAASAIV